jgi:hypothetical protein
VGKNRDEAARVSRKLEAAVGEDLFGLALEVHGYLVEDTPVDTGHARINWTPSVAVPDTREIEGGNAPRAEVRAEGVDPVTTLASARPSDVIFITNNVPYIQYLDAHHPEKRGFVEAALKKAVDRRKGRRLG